jgi:alcohol dehydrogenase YqhD (iron-dependent ADH family)
MIPFEFSLPTRLVFGPGEFRRLGKLAATLGANALLVTGRRAMRELGVLDRAMELFKTEGVNVVLYDRVEPNPLVSTVNRGGALARDENVNVVIGLGGGSAMDAAKGIALIAKNPGSIWDYVKKVNMVETLPVMTVPTISATGSEANRGGVVTEDSSRQKGPFFAPNAQPKISIIDPKLTLTVSLEYTMDGVMDIMSHVLETYFTGVDDTPLQDRMTEAIVQTTMEAGEALYRNPRDLAARTRLCWCSSIALCGLVQSGRGGSWPLHGMQHALSGHYNISHGRGLAILFPRLIAYSYPHNPAKYAQFARTIFAVQESDDVVAAEKGLELLVKWLDGVGLYQALSDVGIDDSKFDAMADDTMALYGNDAGYIDSHQIVDRQSIIEIYQNSLK